MQNLLPDIKITKVSDLTANGTSTVNSSVVDMANYETAVFFTFIATAAAGNVLKVQQGQASNLSDAADLAGSGQSAGTSEEVVAVEIVKPLERYLRATVVRGTSTVLGEIWCIQANPRNRPVTSSLTGTAAVKTVVSPAEGTA